MKIVYDIKYIYDNDVINIPELNLLYDMFNPSKTTKMLIIVIPLSYMSVWINAEARQYISLILLYGECSSTILMIIPTSKIKRKKILLCNGKHKRVKLQLIIEFKYIWPYLSLV